MKEYAMNVRYTNGGSDWNEADNADWFETWEEAFEAAEEAFSDQEIEEAMITVFENGDVEGSPLHMIREDGDIHQYQNGERLWA